MFFNKFIDGDKFRKGAIEVNTSFHVTIALHEHVDKMRRTVKFAEESPQGNRIDSIERSC